MKKKQGFTLIELIAVIIILAILSFIVVPVMIDSIRHSEKKTFKNSIHGILESVRIDTANDKYNVPRLYYYKDGDLTLLKVNNVEQEEKVKTDGKLMAEGYIYVLGDGSIITNNIEGTKYCGYNSSKDTEIVVQENDGTCPAANLFLPTIILKGESPIYVGIGDTFVDPGVEAKTISGEELEYTSVIYHNGTEVGKVDTSYETNYVIRYSASNSGETATVDRVVRVIDMQPTITITPPDPTYVKKKDVVIAVAPVAPNLLERVTYQIDSGDIVTMEKSKTITFDQDGEYYITVNAVDDHGHSNTVRKGPYKIDVTPPTITVPDTTIIDTTEVATFDPMENVVVNDNHPETVTVDTDSEVAAIPGDYTVTYTARDEAGNSTTVTRIVKVVETEGPILSLQPNGTSGWVEQVSITITATDNSDIESFTYQIYKNNSLLENGVVSGSGKSFSDQINFTTSGVYKIILSASDIYGNDSTVTSNTYSVDNVKPVITGANNVSIVKGTSFTVMNGVEATDDMSGIQSFIASPTTVDTSKAGVTTITYTAVDNAGNQATVTRTVTVTTEPPTIQFALVGSPINGNGWANANFTITVTGVDNSGLGIKQIKWCNANSDTCTPATIINASNGSATVSVEGTNTRVCAIATDNNGVSSANTCTSAYQLDKKAPTITATSSTATMVEGTSKTVISYFTTNKNGYADITSTSCIDTSNSNASVSNTSGLSIGSHAIKCTVTKANGLSANATVTITVQEAIASIGTTLYTTLNNAVAAVTNSTATTIKILKNYTQTTQVTIPASRNITIDLNGKTITSTVTTYSGMLINNSNLELKTSVAGGKITSSNTKLLTNNSTGTLKFTSGTYSYTGTSAYTVSNSSTGTIQVNGGTISSSGYSALYNSSTGIVNVAGGAVSGSNDDVIMNYSGTINVTGGTVTSTADSGWAIYNGGTLNVSNGTISGLRGVYVAGSSAKGYFTGGTLTASKYSTLEVSGTAEINGSTIKTTAGQQSDGYYAAVRTYNPGVITMKSGSISGDNNILVAVNGDSKIIITGGSVISGSTVTMMTNYNEGILEIQNGTFEKTVGGNLIWNAANGTVNVKGGTFTSAGSGFSQGSRDADTTGVINVTGGNLTVSEGSGVNVADAGTINVSNATITSNSRQLDNGYYYSIFSLGGCNSSTTSYGKGTINVMSGNFISNYTIMAGIHENAKFNVKGGNFTVKVDVNGFNVYTGGTVTMTGGTLKVLARDMAIATYSNGSDTHCYATSGATITVGDKNATLSKTSPLIYSTDYYAVVADAGTFNFYNGKIGGSTSYGAYKTSGATLNTRGSVYSGSETIDGNYLSTKYFNS